MLGIQDGFGGTQGEETRRALVAGIFYIKLFAGGLFLGFFWLML